MLWRAYLILPAISCESELVDRPTRTHLEIILSDPPIAMRTTCELSRHTCSLSNFSKESRLCHLEQLSLLMYSKDVGMP